MNLLELTERELKSGCKDSVVFGGYAAYLKKWALRKSDTDLADLASLYVMASVSQRVEMLLKIKQLVAKYPENELVAPEKPPVAASFIGGQVRPSLETPVQYLKNLGPCRAAIFKTLGINTVSDLLFYFPRDYRDRRQVIPLAELVIGEAASVCGKVTKTEEMRPNPRISIIKSWISDGTAIIPAIWFNQKFLKTQLVEGREIMIYGRLEHKYGKLQLTVSEYEFCDDGGEGWGILPVYRSTETISQKLLRSTVGAAYEKYSGLIQEIIPDNLVQKRGLPPRSAAVGQMHFPKTFEEKELARRRFAYEELLLLELALIKNSAVLERQGIAHPGQPKLLEKFKAALPYSLTGAQERVIAEIFNDMESETCMARLLQGDVGSGKTTVAAAAVYKSTEAGFQSALMAPTEILAMQHYKNLLPLMKSLGVRIELFTGGTTGEARTDILERLKNGEIDVIVGTHTLIQDAVVFKKLSLAITDEQHRFGVAQRAQLQEKGLADILVMTATPIPRTLALAFYGDLRLSVIDELPPGRQKIKTYAVGYDYEQRIWNFLEKEMAAGHQTFIVCPLIEESEKIDLESATKLYESISQNIFKNRRIGLLHGRQKPAEKEEIMKDFAAQRLDMLVSTTVIEVGIDIPNATVMLIRDAERFGLAQLHQLRGRIGRGAAQSYCILMNNARGDIARERMRTMVGTDDGFKIAEADLALRGPGEFFGTRQHGIPELRVANLFTDGLILEQAREDAYEILASDGLDADPQYGLLRFYLSQKEQMLN